MRCARQLVFALLAASFLWASPAENPANALKSDVEAARASLAAGDLSSAEQHYIDAITLGLREAAQLSLAAGDLNQAAVHLGESLKLRPDDVDTQVAAADVRFRKGDVAQAESTLSAVIAKDPQNSQAHSLLGRIYVFTGDSDKAIDELKASGNVESDFETGYYLGIAYLKARKLDETSAWFQHLETKMGNSAALHVLFGRAYLIANLSQKAIPEFSKAIALEPTYPRAHGFLGFAYLEYYQEEGYPRAKEEFQKELRLHPNDFHVQELLGISDVNLRDFPGAELALLHAIRLQPREASPYLYLGESYAATNRTKAAVDMLEKYVALIGNPADDQLREASRAYYLLGQGLRRLGREDDARKALARSQQIRETKFKYDVQHIFDEKKNPDQTAESRVSDPVADLLSAGSAQQKQDAEKMMQRGVSTDPAVKPVTPGETESVKQYRAVLSDVLGSSYNDLGVMRAKESKFADAAEFFTQAAAWKPDLPGLDRNWGLAEFRSEVYKDAIPPLDRRLRAHPDDAFVRQLLGLSYSMVEDDQKVVEVLRPFLEHPPDDPGLLLAWGTSLVHTHQSAAAAGIFRRLIDQNGNNPSVHLLLGKAYAQQEDYPNALAEFDQALQLDAKLPEAHYDAGLVYLLRSEFDSAGREFRAELALRPGEPHVLYHLGYTLLQQGNLLESIDLLRESAKAMPQYEPAYFELGRAELQQGDLAGAINSLETAKKLNPDHDAAYFQLSQAYRRASRAQEATQMLATYQRLIEANRLKKRKILETDKP